jgi:hypothetical protein
MFSKELVFISTSPAPSFTLIKLLFYKLISYTSKFFNVNFPSFISTNPVVIIDYGVFIFNSQLEISIDAAPLFP